MGWLIAFLFFLIAVAALTLLAKVWLEKAEFVTRLQNAERRSSALEREVAEKPRLVAERDQLAAAYAALRQRVQGIVDADAERERVLADAKQRADRFNTQLAEANRKFDARKLALDTEIARLESLLGPLRHEHQTLSEEASLAEMGYYKSHFGFATSQRYKKAIEENAAKQKAMLLSKMAARCSREWTIDGSVELGRKQTDKYLSLILRAFNGECDSAIAKLKPANYQTMENRIRKSFDAINKLSEMQYCTLSADYLNLRLEELLLEHEHLLKLQAEREQQRAIKEEMRQQAIAEREIERAQQEAEREERQYEAALAKARQEFERASKARQAEMLARIAELEQLAAEAHLNKERALSRAQQTKSGFVYVISNIGSFGANVYKIGMTRRLDPMDRIWELSDASVPFDFDVHAVIYADDAPKLEAELHRRFTHRRMNVVNQRKEFFDVTIEEIANVVRECCGDIELTLVAEAVEYLQSEAYRRENGLPLLTHRVYDHLSSPPYMTATGSSPSPL